MCTGTKEFARSVWNEAFRSHTERRIDLELLFDFTPEGIYFCVCDTNNRTDYRITEFSAADWRFHRISYLTLHTGSMYEGFPVSIEELLYLIDFIALHSSNRVLKHTDLQAVAEHTERVLRKLDDSRILCRSLFAAGPIPDEPLSQFLWRQCESDVFQILNLNCHSHRQARVTSAIERFCFGNQGRGRHFCGNETVLDSPHLAKPFLQQAIESWKAQRKVPLDITIRRSHNVKKESVVESLKHLMGVDPVVRPSERQWYIINGNTYSTNSSFLSSQHPTENEVFEVEISDDRLYITRNSLSFFV